MPSSLWGEFRNYYNVLLFLGISPFRGLMVMSETVCNAAYLMKDVLDVIRLIYVSFWEWNKCFKMFVNLMAQVSLVSRLGNIVESLNVSNFSVATSNGLFSVFVLFDLFKMCLILSVNPVLLLGLSCCRHWFSPQCTTPYPLGTSCPPSWCSLGSPHSPPLHSNRSIKPHLALRNFAVPGVFCRKVTIAIDWHSAFSLGNPYLGHMPYDFTGTCLSLELRPQNSKYEVWVRGTGFSFHSVSSFTQLNTYLSKWFSALW